jgi:hypothetical protein
MVSRVSNSPAPQRVSTPQSPAAGPVRPEPTPAANRGWAPGPPRASSVAVPAVSKGLTDAQLTSMAAAAVAQSKAAGLYRQPVPNNQDAQNNAVAGLGGKYLDAMPSFVFSPRRQTDQMARQAHALLPEALKRDVAFVQVTRLAQDPEGAAREMAGKKEVVLVGCLKGVNSATSDDPKVTAVHEKELKALEVSMTLAKGMGVKVRDVVLGMGDSSPQRVNGKYVANPFAETKRAQLESRVGGILKQGGYTTPERLSWGADELMLCAFAAQLPPRTLSVNLQSPDSKFFYDSDATTRHLVEEAAQKSGLTLVRDGKADMRLEAFSLLPGANVAGDQTFPDPTELALQRQSDAAFSAKLKGLSKDELARTVIIDARLNNGAMDTVSLPPTLDCLGYGSWGTGGNNFGQGLAMAKIVSDAEARAKASGNPTAVEHAARARRQFVVEGVAHDAFFIGYGAGLSGASVGDGKSNAMSSWLKQSGLPLAPGQSLPEDKLVELYRRASDSTNRQLQERYPGLEGRVKYIPQPFNRRFEAATVYSEGVIPQSGSVSTELTAKYPEFRPGATYRGFSPLTRTGAAVGSNGLFF